MARDKARNVEWGSANRPKISNKLGIPHSTEGSDGDIQIRQTNLGAKLFGKIGGRWSSTFLSNEEEVIGTSGTRIGMDSSGALTVDQIKLTGKITLTSSGTQNVCIGIDNSDSGQNNITIGVKAGSNLDSSTNGKNVLIGSEAGRYVNDGYDNIFIGQEAGKGVNSPKMSGRNNIAIGEQALYVETTGVQNIAIGNTSMYASQGSDFNVCVGYASGDALLTGQSNTCIGNQSGTAINTGNYNIALGNSSSNVTSGHGNVVIGDINVADATADNQLTIGSGNGDVAWIYGISSGRVGIGISPNAKLTVEGTISLKEQSDDVGSVAGYSQIWVDDAGAGTLMFTNDSGTKYTVDVTAV